MDAQKISEAAATIKKVEHAAQWFNRFPNELDVKNIVIETVGNATAVTGHGEAKWYLRRAFDHHRAKIMELAMRLAEQDRAVAEQDIREEVTGS